MKRWPVLLGLMVIVGGIVYSCAFIVTETQQVFLTQFGRPVGKPIVKPGIHFKIPFIQKAHFFDKRFLEWDGNPNQVPTKDKRYISIDTYARWRIEDPLTFFQKVGDELGAQTRLDDILDGATRNAVANHDLVEIVRSQPRPDRVRQTNDVGDVSDTLSPFTYGRERITKDILASARPQLEKWGIELLDIRFKRINYEQDVKQKIFERMISERQRIADKYRSEGQGEASKILGESERDLKTITSDAYRQVQGIEGKADADAAAIYAAAYNQSKGSQEFYRFVKTMQTYQSSLTNTDWLILSTKDDFYRYLRSAAP